MTVPSYKTPDIRPSSRPHSLMGESYQAPHIIAEQLAYQYIRTCDPIDPELTTLMSREHISPPIWDRVLKETQDVATIKDNLVCSTHYYRAEDALRQEANWMSDIESPKSEFVQRFQKNKQAWIDHSQVPDKFILGIVSYLETEAQEKMPLLNETFIKTKEAMAELPIGQRLRAWYGFSEVCRDDVSLLWRAKTGEGHLSSDLMDFGSADKGLTAALVKGMSPFIPELKPKQSIFSRLMGLSC
jgi:hypothetical protein